MQEIASLQRIVADPLARTAGSGDNNVGLFQQSRASDSSILFPCEVLGADFLGAESCECLDGGGDLGGKLFCGNQDEG
jgi:hypothetical protein